MKTFRIGTDNMSIFIDHNLPTSPNKKLFREKLMDILNTDKLTAKQILHLIEFESKEHRRNTFIWMNSLRIDKYASILTFNYSIVDPTDNPQEYSFIMKFSDDSWEVCLDI